MTISFQRDIKHGSPQPEVMIFLTIFLDFLTVAGLAQSVERLTVEWEVISSIPGTGPILRGLKISFPCKQLDLHVAQMTM